MRQSDSEHLLIVCKPLDMDVDMAGIAFGGSTQAPDGQPSDAISHSLDMEDVRLIFHGICLTEVVCAYADPKYCQSNCKHGSVNPTF